MGYSVKKLDSPLGSIVMQLVLPGTMDGTVWVDASYRLQGKLLQVIPLVHLLASHFDIHSQNTLKPHHIL